MSAKRNSTETRKAEPSRYSWPVQASRLPRQAAYRFDIQPDQADQEDIASFLKIPTVSKLRFRGALHPVGEDAWRADARMTASTVQNCVVTLAPVPQAIDERVERAYVPHDSIAAIAEIDLDMNADDDPDEFDGTIDLGALLIEALALALEPYPRAEDAKLADTIATPPGAEPLTDDALKPFAKLSALRDKLSGGGA